MPSTRMTIANLVLKDNLRQRPLSVLRLDLFLSYFIEHHTTLIFTFLHCVFPAHSGRLYNIIGLIVMTP